MKKIVLLAVAVLFASAAVFAQDMAEATENYNNGAMSLQMGDYSSALASFKTALAQAEACGEEGEEVVANCKNIIPSIILSQGKEAARDKKFDEAIATLGEAIEVAKEYGNDDVVDQAEELIPGLRLQKANTFLSEKDYPAAIEAYNDVIANDPENATAYLRLGSAYTASNQIDEAIAAYDKATEYGEGEAAAKQLSNLYLRNANTALRDKQYQEALNAALKSNEFNENANAYKIAASASQRLNKNSDAIKYYEGYLGLEPNAKDAGGINFTIAALYQQAGNKAKALEYYRKVANDAQYGAQAQEQIKALQ